MALKQFQTIKGSISLSVDFLEPETDKAGNHITQYIMSCDYYYTAGGSEPDPVTGYSVQYDAEIDLQKIGVTKQKYVSTAFGQKHWIDLATCELSNEFFFHPDELERIFQAIRDQVEEKYTDQ